MCIKVECGRTLNLLIVILYFVLNSYFNWIQFVVIDAESLQHPLCVSPPIEEEILTAELEIHEGKYRLI